MANRNFSGVQSLDREVKLLFGYVVFGASGAVSSVDALGFTVTKVAATTGRYTITLEDKYNALVGIAFAPYNAGTAAGEQWEVRTNLTSSTTITIEHVSDAGAAADAASGNGVYITLALRNSAVPRKGTS
jgi:hypothetical protein